MYRLVTNGEKACEQQKQTSVRNLCWLWLFRTTVCRYRSTVHRMQYDRLSQQQL